jgi:hypothetical protein
MTLTMVRINILYIHNGTDYTNISIKHKFNGIYGTHSSVRIEFLQVAFHSKQDSILTYLTSSQCDRYWQCCQSVKRSKPKLLFVIQFIRLLTLEVTQTKLGRSENRGCGRSPHPLFSEFSSPNCVSPEPMKNPRMDQE